MRRIIRVFLIVCLFFLIIADKQTNCALAGNDEFVNRVEEDYFISAIIEEQWENKMKILVTIENTGAYSIDNWSVSFDMSADIIDIWDAKICAQVGEIFVVKNVEYNQDILAGDSVSFGFIAEIEDDFVLPEDFLMLVKSVEVDKEDYSIEVVVNSEWEEEYSGEILITNETEDIITDWTLDIRYDTYITSIWNGNLISDVDYQYKIENLSYNQNIYPGETISIGFIGEKKNEKIDIEKCVLTQMTTTEVVDNLIDKSLFVDIIPVTEDYFVSPLYSLDGNVSAYLVQYYDEIGNGCGYIVVSNAVNAEENYYIEFGYGNAPVITELREAFEEYIGEEYRIIYMGGYWYYIESSSGYYSLQNNVICKLSDDKLDLVDTIYGTRYYEEGETLKYADILKKEVGYLKKGVKKSLDNTPAKTYITGGEAREKYKTENGIKIANHCAPTAATNLLINLSRKYSGLNVNKNNYFPVFEMLYDEMETTENGTSSDSLVAIESVLSKVSPDFTVAYMGELPFVSWEEGVDQINKGPILLGLMGSQIYWDEDVAGDVEEYEGWSSVGHLVLGTGYISFPHSNGWVSNYYQIIDGWYNDDYRYVNHSLGIDYLVMFWFDIGTASVPHPTPTPN